MIEINNISKVFCTSEVETVALVSRKPRSQRGRVCSHYGAVRLWQVHFAEYTRFVG